MHLNINFNSEGGIIAGKIVWSFIGRHTRIEKGSKTLTHYNFFLKLMSAGTFYLICVSIIRCCDASVCKHIIDELCIANLHGASINLNLKKLADKTLSMFWICKISGWSKTNLIPDERRSCSSYNEPRSGVLRQVSNRAHNSVEYTKFQSRPVYRPFWFFVF